MARKAKTKVRALRARLRINQDVFWKRVGVSQSAGSRYETGRQLPAPVRTLADIAYGDEKQRAKAFARLLPGFTVTLKKRS